MSTGLKTPLNTLLVAAMITVCLLPLAGARDVPKAELISGEVISLSNYLMRGLTGEENAVSGVFQSEERGLPVAILDQENGELYIAVGKNATSPNPKLLPLMGKMVNAQGPVYRRHGVQLIEIQIVAEQ
jgi:hypothetical protein